MLVTFGICFKQHFGFNTGLTDPFMSHLTTQLGYSAREFHALQLIVLSAFGVLDYLPPACWSTFWKSNFKQQLGCRFDIIDNESYFLCFGICSYICLDTSNSFFGFTFLNILYFCKYSCTNIFHRRSLYTFYAMLYLNFYGKRSY